MDYNSMGYTMPVQPMYGGYPQYGGNGLGGFGDGWWIILLLLLGGGMWGGFGMGGWGGMMGAGMMGMDWLYPWLNNSQNINGGFRDQNLQNSIDTLRSDTNDGFRDIRLQRSIEGVRDAVGSGFSAVQLGQAGISKEICATGRDITGTVRDGFANAEIAANGRQMANMQQLFGVQSAIQGNAASSAAGIADLKYTVARENCDDRAAMAQGFQGQTMQGYTNTNNILTEMRAGFQAIKDEICADRIEGYKRQVAERDRQIDALNLRLNYASEQADRIAQTGQIVDGIYSRLSACPVGTTPVYGNQPIFRCSGPSWGNTCPNGSVQLAG